MKHILHRFTLYLYLSESISMAKLLLCLLSQWIFSVMNEIHSTHIQLVSVWISESFSHYWDSLRLCSVGRGLTQWIFQSWQRFVPFMFSGSVFESWIFQSWPKLLFSDIQGLIVWISESVAHERFAALLFSGLGLNQRTFQSWPRFSPLTFREPMFELSAKEGIGKLIWMNHF